MFIQTRTYKASHVHASGHTPTAGPPTSTHRTRESRLSAGPCLEHQVVGVRRQVGRALHRGGHLVLVGHAQVQVVVPAPATGVDHRTHNSCSRGEGEEKGRGGLGPSVQRAWQSMV
jgi:hypothetical protein